MPLTPDKPRIPTWSLSRGQTITLPVEQVFWIRIMVSPTKYAGSLGTTSQIGTCLGISSEDDPHCYKYTPSVGLYPLMDFRQLVRNAMFLSPFLNYDTHFPCANLCITCYKMKTCCRLECKAAQ
ncbi:hypothetical protein IHE45_13G063800 [Dioscorea alata]|uniref:Uncharacterized protein n=2 Tax=Dioscorea alata TaxID=55571 RepID=A0ACB7UYC5_DIOAL|nr:hypothetical protein IHE45_13G063800 [Dioscorea alata]KAH7665906.1 hypothetical protein IHE45_13G063800 [Dioscorea alata]